MGELIPGSPEEVVVTPVVEAPAREVVSWDNVIKAPAPEVAQEASPVIPIPIEVAPVVEEAVEVHIQAGAAPTNNVEAMVMQAMNQELSDEGLHRLSTAVHAKEVHG